MDGEAAKAKMTLAEKQAFDESHICRGQEINHPNISGSFETSWDYTPVRQKNYSLTSWQQKQAAMLSYFSSKDYLTGLHTRVSHLISGTVEPALDLASSQNRDTVLADARWGARTTSENFGNHAWPILKELQAALARNIVDRGSGSYLMSGVYEYFRGLAEISTGWMTPEEEEMFNAAKQKVSSWAEPLDHTLADNTSPAWDDYAFAYYYPAFASTVLRVPRYRVVADISFQTGVVPNQTGVYVSKDDPNAALQFAWAGDTGRKLRPAETFNELGLAALEEVGREDLWFNIDKMFMFATTSKYASILRDEVIWNDGPHPKLAPSAVARSAFTTRDCEWYLVLPNEGEFDSLADLRTTGGYTPRPKIESGSYCEVAGYYFSPAHPNSRRYFSNGQLAPSLDSAYGDTFWQWDPHQE